jgi:AcrR family transcriptional regulator
MSSKERYSRVGMRERILDAAVMVLVERGQGRATTREIARAAGCSEGSLYTHFANKEQLMLAVMAERLPPLIPVLNALVERAGEDTVADHLEEVARSALPFYIKLMPLASAVLAAPDLNESLRSQGFGPQRGNEMLAIYLRLEQRLGRLHAGVSPAAAAALLLGACQQRAMHMQFLGQELDVAVAETFARDLVATLMQGLQPA